MKKRKLEILLSTMDDIDDPDPSLEQYRTPSTLASEILYTALLNEDIEGKKVCELGCGGAPFLAGAWLLGASEVIGIDIDDKCIALARKNMAMVRSSMKDPPTGDVEFMVHDLRKRIPLISSFDTVLMNPPFGAQMTHADRPFIERSMEIAKVCYAIHNGNSYQFLNKMTDALGVNIELLWEDTMEIPARFTFHTKESKEINVVIVRYSR